MLWVTLGLVDRAAGRSCLAASWLPGAVQLPEAGRFNIRGGIEILPEFMALLFGLVIYTGAFIAEVVRAGIMSVVARARPRRPIRSGCGPQPTLRLVVMPQAMRVIIPPLTNQYLNLTKNSSLAVAIGYPDLVQIFAGTVLEPDRAGRGGDRHHHGGLSRRSASSRPWLMNLLQPPHRIGGALSHERPATTTDAAL